MYTRRRRRHRCRRCRHRRCRHRRRRPVSEWMQRCWCLWALSSKHCHHVLLVMLSTTCSRVQYCPVFRAVDNSPLCHVQANARRNFACIAGHVQFPSFLQLWQGKQSYPPDRQRKRDCQKLVLVEGCCQCLEGRDFGCRAFADFGTELLFVAPA